MLKLQDHARAAHLWPTAHHGDLASGLCAFFFSFLIVRLLTACIKVKSHAKIQWLKFLVLYAEHAYEIYEY